MTEKYLREKFNLPEKIAQTVKNFLGNKKIKDPETVVSYVLETGATKFFSWDSFPQKERDKDIQFWREIEVMPGALSNAELAISAELWRHLFFFFKEKARFAKSETYTPRIDFVDPAKLVCTESILFTNPGVLGSVIVNWSLMGDTPVLLLANYSRRKLEYLPFVPEVWEDFMQQFGSFWESVKDKNWEEFSPIFDGIEEFSELEKEIEFLRDGLETPMSLSLGLKYFNPMEFVTTTFKQQKTKTKLILEEKIARLHSLLNKKSSQVILESWTKYHHSLRGKKIDEAFVFKSSRVHRIPPVFVFGENFVVKTFVSEKAIPMFSISYREAPKTPGMSITFTPKCSDFFYDMRYEISEAFDRLQDGYSYIGDNPLISKKTR